MPNKFLVSIVVPTLNEEAFLERTLKALLNQTISKDRYEIVVCDSSSADNTVKIAKRYADKVVVCEKHSAGYGRNFGADNTSGKLIGFVDADTIVSETWVEGLIESLETAVGCTGPIESLEKDSLKMNIFFTWWGIQSRLSIMAKHPIFPGFNIGIRKDAFKKIGGFSMENITTEDIDLGLKLKKVNRIVFNNKMSVKTSTRRLKEISVPAYIWNGISFALFGKSRKWSEHRKDF